jgi:hypothetical protein
MLHREVSAVEIAHDYARFVVRNVLTNLCIQCESLSLISNIRRIVGIHLNLKCSLMFVLSHVVVQERMCPMRASGWWTRGCICWRCWRAWCAQVSPLPLLLLPAICWTVFPNLFVGNLLDGVSPSVCLGWCLD